MQDSHLYEKPFPGSSLQLKHEFFSGKQYVADPDDSGDSSSLVRNLGKLFGVNSIPPNSAHDLWMVKRQLLQA